MKTMIFARLSAASFGWLCLRLLTPLIFGTLVGVAVVGSTKAASPLRQAAAAVQRQDYAAALAIFSPLAQRGNADAQAYMGYLYEIGRGVPQDFTQAAIWYRRAAEQGQSWAQFQLAMLYDKGHGVPVDAVEAEKWLILAAAAAPPSAVDDRSRMRDAVVTKLTRGELAEARMRALAWKPHRE